MKIKKIKDEKNGFRFFILTLKWRNQTGGGMWPSMYFHLSRKGAKSGWLLMWKKTTLLPDQREMWSEVSKPPPGGGYSDQITNNH